MPAQQGKHFIDNLPSKSSAEKIRAPQRTWKDQGPTVPHKGPGNSKAAHNGTAAAAPQPATLVAKMAAKVIADAK
jgi:hypothetical protein